MADEHEKTINDTIYEKIYSRFTDGILSREQSYGLLTITVDSKKNYDLISFLQYDLNFGFLTDLTGIHYPDNELPLGVIYHLHNLEKNIRIRVKTFLQGDSPHIGSITSLFRGADWMERETYDFYGIIFDGHTDLRRILNMDDMAVFPMRKEYPLEDSNRKDKNDSYFGR